MRSFKGCLESPSRGHLNSSFTFVPTISNDTPAKKEMQEKFLPVPKKIYAAPTRLLAMVNGNEDMVPVMNDVQIPGKIEAELHRGGADDVQVEGGRRSG
jgi:hypothetical protein